MRNGDDMKMEIAVNVVPDANVAVDNIPGEGSLNNVNASGSVNDAYVPGGNVVENTSSEQNNITAADSRPNQVC